MRCSRVFLLALSLAGVSCATAAEPRTPVAAFEPCERPDIAGRVECGRVAVPEDRARPGGRSLRVFFLRVRATGEATDDPIFFFTGGPGSAASASGPFLSGEFDALRATRDLVFIDQRGTGQSHPLRCPFDGDVTARLAPMFDASHAAACRARLERDHDLRFYTTRDAAHDVDDVRRSLGYARINLHGSSYGTRAAWAYAAQFPAHARTMILWGVAPPGFYLPEPFAQGLEVALEGVIAACLAERECGARHPDLRRGVQRAFDRLRGGPATVRVSARDGVVREGKLTRDEFAEAVRYQLYFMHRTRTLPSMLARAAAGDYSPIAQASVTNRFSLEDLNRGMFLTVTCTEDLPFIDANAARAAFANTRLGIYRVQQQMEACRDWPRGNPDWSAGARPLQTPALVQNGEFDPATPLAGAREGMRLLPNGTLVIVPHGAHNFAGLGVDDCLRRMNTAFITRGTAEGLDTSCIAASKRQPFQ